MPHHDEQRFLPYTPEQIFALVEDVRRYPEFLPWCVGSRVFDEHDGGFSAEMIIGFKMFRETFTTKDTLTPPADGAPGRIHVEYIRGPMRHLTNDWKLTAHSDASGVTGTMVDFVVDFEFKSRILEKMIGPLFEEAVHRMVAAFETRADALYGKKG